jgi:hypothetical protein
MYLTFSHHKIVDCKCAVAFCLIYWSSNLRIKGLPHKNVELEVNGPYRFVRQNVKIVMRVK